MKGLGSKGSVLPLRKLLVATRRLRRKGKRIAFTNGCFDLLHAGHLDYLERIKRQADVLVVAVNSDSSIRKIKGPSRPIVTEKERARLVASLRPVDYVTIFSEPTPLKVIEAIRPDLLAKGGDWNRERIVGREIVEFSGGKVIRIPYLKGHSTTGLIRKIRRCSP